jgi:hypothetical protein
MTLLPRSEVNGGGGPPPGLAEGEPEDRLRGGGGDGKRPALSLAPSTTLRVVPLPRTRGRSFR